ncbi:MAG: hypothetical protein ABI705_09025 [Aestuariivirga sp.]
MTRKFHGLVACGMLFSLTCIVGIAKSEESLKCQLKKQAYTKCTDDGLEAAKESGDYSYLANCERKYGYRQICNQDSSLNAPEPESSSGSSSQNNFGSQPSPSPDVLTETPPVQQIEESGPLTEKGLYDKMFAACHEPEAFSEELYGILHCYDLATNELFRDFIWRQASFVCTELRKECHGKYHDKLVNYSRQYRCDSIGQPGDVCE